LAIKAGAQKKWLEREMPQRWVGIEQSFAMSRFPVTVGQWRQFVRATGWESQSDVDWRAPGFAQNDEHPVVGVSWMDAQLYLRWLSQKTGQVYRLPSEAEWEYACRAGTRTAFSFGDVITPEQANYDGNYTYNGSPRGTYLQGTSKAGVSSRIRGDCSTCTVTCGSGPRMSFTITTSARRPMAARGKRAAIRSGAFCAAAPGCTTRVTCARQCATVTRQCWPTILSDSAWRASWCNRKRGRSLPLKPG
jgi:hypothetical protein